MCSGEEYVEGEWNCVFREGECALLCLTHFVAAGVVSRAHWRGHPCLQPATGRAAGPGTAATAALSPFPEEVRPDDDADAACRLVVRRL